MSWQVLVTPSALEMLKSIRDRRVRRQVYDAISRLSVDPEKKGKPLIGEFAGYHSMSAAGQKYRIIYRIEQERFFVVVVAVGRRKDGDRKDIYELARKLFKQKLLK